MAKAKKKAKKTARRKHEAKPSPRVPVAVVPAIQDIRDSAGSAPRAIALPELWCKIEAPVRVVFLEKMRADAAPAVPGGRKRPAMLARVMELGETANARKDLAMPEALAAVFASIPSDGYVGRKYRITRHRRHERKNAAGYTVEEVE